MGYKSFLSTEFSSSFGIIQGILDASRQRHNALWRSKSETNLKGQMYRSNHSNKHHRHRPSNASVVDAFDLSGNLENGEMHGAVLGSKDSIDTVSCLSLSTSTELPSPVCARRPKSWSPDDNAIRLMFPPTQGE